MQTGDDILKLLREKGAEAVWQSQRGLVLQPGAIGDCVLTLPLVAFMKESVGLGGVDVLGHTEYIGILPGRTCADGVRSMDSVDLHRLFCETSSFDLADGDPLISVFADYSWIVTFLGEPDSNFEENLIFTANCSHSAEVIALSQKAPKGYSGHIAGFYMEQFADRSGMSLEPVEARAEQVLMKATEADVKKGSELLGERGIDFSKKIVVIQPGSGSPEKCWHLGNFLAVAKELSGEGLEVIFLLGPAESERFSEDMIRDICGVAKCMADVSLPQVLGILRLSDRFIGNDSGITHLAAGLGVRTICVWGPTDANVYKPIGPAVELFSSSGAVFSDKPSMKAQRELLEFLIQ